MGAYTTMTKQRAILAPFLYPFLLNQTPRSRYITLNAVKRFLQSHRWQSTVNDQRRPDETPSFVAPSRDLSHLNPSPDDYSRFLFQDKCTVTVYAGSGGNGCVSFHREKYVEEGPPNGGDGGTGGSVFIQAVEGLTSLHKLARRGVIKAGRGKNGQGKSQGGKRGKDVLIQVPVGTVVRELARYDPVEEEELRLKAMIAEMGEDEALQLYSSSRDRWVLYPGSVPSDYFTTTFPVLPPRRSNLAALQPKAPIHLDLSEPMEKPMLLAAGAVGGYGNPHFVSRSISRPNFASKGEAGMRLDLEFELKLLADVGLVGKPNAGKSTLLRSLTNSRTRIGSWEFTTLTPNIGTVVIDNHKGRPLVESDPKAQRTNFTIADIPGLIEDAHLNRGLGLGFLRHIERARILAFVIDLSSGDSVQALKALWCELAQYERLRNAKDSVETGDDLINWRPFDEDLTETSLCTNSDSGPPVHVAYAEEAPLPNRRSLPPLRLPPIYTKPWFVVATKADLPGTQENFFVLRDYLSKVEKGEVEHPGGYKDGWKQQICAIPVSAIRGEGVGAIPRWVVGLLDRKS